MLIPALQGIISLSGLSSFEDAVASTNPFAWYDTQDANYQTIPLADRSGNDLHLPRNSATRTVATGSPFTTTKTKCIAFDGIWDSNWHYWKDGSGILNPYASNVPNLTMTFTMRYRQVSQSYSHICGWKIASSSSIILSATTQNATGDNVTCWSENFNNEVISTWYDTPDTDIHIFTFRYASGVVTIFKDGVLVGTQTHTVQNNTYSGVPPFQIGGGWSGSFELFCEIDHVHLNNTLLDNATIIAMHNSFIAELI